MIYIKVCQLWFEIQGLCEMKRGYASDLRGSAPVQRFSPPGLVKTTDDVYSNYKQHQSLASRLPQ